MKSKPRILFVATREPSYPRVAMTLEGLRESFDVTAIVSERSSYPLRILEIGWRFTTMRKRDFDVMFVGFFAQPIIPLISMFWRGPLIVDAFISIFDSYVLDKGLTTRHSLLARVTKWLDCFALKKADLALVDTLEHEKFFRTLLEGRRLPIMRRLWASAQEDVFSPLETLQYDPEGAEEFEVLFWGAFIPLQGVEVIVRAANLLENEGVRISLVGTGQTYEGCVALVERLELSNLCFLGWKEPEELRELSARSHLLLGIFGKTEKAERVIPNKVFQALSLAKPLVTGRSAGIGELLVEGDNVVLCNMNDYEDLARSVLWVKNNYEKTLLIANKGRQVFVETASSKSRIDTLRDAVSAASRAK